MADEPIDFNAERNKREAPDAEHVRKDGFGREMYEFLLWYEYDGSTYSATIWAYSAEEAEKRVEAMRQTLSYQGQIFTTIPG